MRAEDLNFRTGDDRVRRPPRAPRGGDRGDLLVGEWGASTLDPDREGRPDIRGNRLAVQAGAAGEAIIRTPLKELVTQLDAEQFVQVHRSVVVNLCAIAHVTRGPNETADIHLKGRDEVLPVSRSYLHVFRQM